MSEETNLTVFSVADAEDYEYEEQDGEGDNRTAYYHTVADLDNLRDLLLDRLDSLDRDVSQETEQFLGSEECLDEYQYCSRRSRCVGYSEAISDARSAINAYFLEAMYG